MNRELGNRRVTKAVIPVAGLGTRLRPMTKYLPKELLPVGGKPMIQQVLEMYMASGIFEFCVVTSPRKPLLNDFLEGRHGRRVLPFSRDRAFEERLASCKLELRLQPEPKGVAHAVCLAADFVGSDPFLCIMPDCLLFSPRPFALQLVEAFEDHQKNVIGTIYVSAIQRCRFGNVGVLTADRLDHRTFVLRSLSDKKLEPLSIEGGRPIHKGFGGGIYCADYFDLAKTVQPGPGGEIDDVPIHRKLIEEEKLLGVLLEGAAFDAGNPLGFRAAVLYAGRPQGRQTAVESPK